jgi:hypothetical protein
MIWLPSAGKLRNCGHQSTVILYPSCLTPICLPRGSNCQANFANDQSMRVSIPPRISSYFQSHLAVDYHSHSIRISQNLCTETQAYQILMIREICIHGHGIQDKCDEMSQTEIKCGRYPEILLCYQLRRSE